ncbi:hypothetical protein H5410_056202 [Solanum commersonii]|uniref:Uncharacterized protein n=1 Tax=Solanum commersonii TaxID=4109 RepID=A0A9J5WLK4_SOLCO|nr:hypothetical protein H5410_056202 [Solanum commersonii]
MQCSHSQRRTHYMLSPISFPVFSNRQLFHLTQDQKGLFKACKGAECKVVKKYAAMDHSAQLVGIANALDDPPFGLLHHFSAFAFSIFAVQHTGTLGEVEAIWRLARSSGFLFFIFSVILFFFAK